jgi:two-component system, cell cycle response regulator CpdR
MDDKPKRVLIVEDDAELREMIAEVVRTGPYEVHVAGDGQQALQRLRQHGYDLILCDLFMPVMNGPAFYREVRRSHPNSATKIAFMTAHRNLDEYASFLRDVRAPVLFKPFAWAKLRETMARMLGAHEGHELVDPGPSSVDPFV